MHSLPHRLFTKKKVVTGSAVIQQFKHVPHINSNLYRPFDLRRAQSKIFKKPLDDSCSERHLEMLEYLEKFMQAYPGEYNNKFSMRLSDNFYLS